MLMPGACGGFLGKQRQLGLMSIDSKSQSESFITSLRGRLSSWWEGDEAQDVDAVVNGASMEGGGDDAVDGISWPAPRLAAAQLLFGEGCTFPGSKEAIIQLIEPLKLNDTQAVVDMRAGIGTATRIIAQETGAKVDGLELDPAQLELATRLAVQAGLGDKVAMLEGAIGRCNIEPDSRDAVFSRGALLGLAEKDAAFLDIWTMLKPGGQVLLADFMAKTANEAKDDAADWAKFKKMKPYLATVDQIRQGLSAAHLDVHELEDRSEQFCSHILRGLAGLATTLKQGSVPKDQRPWVMWEVELWARRIAMLQAGNIGFYRVHASKSAD